MKGSIWGVEWSEHQDAVTGLTVRQLTDYKGHSHHLYFTNPGWYDGGRRLLFASDRNNQTHLFSLDLSTGLIRQLTDKSGSGPHDETSFLNACLNPRRNEAYFWRGHDVAALDLDTLTVRTLFTRPGDFRGGILNCTADGQFLCTALVEDLSGRFPMDLLHGYVGFQEHWEARPRSRIVKIATDGTDHGTVFEEDYWIGHVNTSPTQPHLVSFCHEGPWDQVDQRVWGVDLKSGRVWKIRPTREGERIGHEYWLADGVTLGYHGHVSKLPIFGFTNYDNTERQEAAVDATSTHFHSNTSKLIVGDGTVQCPYILLWRWQGAHLEGPRIVCRHRGSFHIQQTHVHPRFSPDGHSILYTSDANGYGNLYQVEVPEFEALKPLEV